MNKKIVAVWLCAALATTAFVIPLNGSNDAEGKIVVIEAITYIVNAPFRINSNADFPTYANGGGNGSLGSPWIIENYDINGTGHGYCLFFGNTTEHFIVKDCHLHDATDGDVYWLDNSGIQVYNCTRCSITNCTIERTGYAANMKYSNDFELKSNTLRDNQWMGVLAFESDLGRISDNLLDNSSAIYLHNSYGSLVKNNTVLNSPFSGVSIWNSTESQILGNSVVGETGIILSDSWNNTVANNDCGNGMWGIQVVHSTFNDIKDNVLHDNIYYGLYLNQADNNTMTGNEAVGNMDGIHLKESNFNDIQNNTLTSNTIGVNIVSSNDTVVANNDLSYNAYGFYCAHSDRNTIVGNNASNNLYGSGGYLYFSSDSVVQRNMFCSNSNQGLAIINSSHGNSVLNNTICDNYEGIITDHSNWLNISDNVIEGNTWPGISLTYGTNSVIHGNRIFNNGWGVATFQSSSNLIYHNMFILNTYQAINRDLANSWDNGYPSGGNYWSDYTGVDRYSGPGQNGPSPDGIGDTPYDDIEGLAGIMDHYPLIHDSSEDPFPLSYVDYVNEYWCRNPSVNLSVTAIDTVDGAVSDITLLYSYSHDNATWSQITSFDEKTAEPWNWTFDFPEGEGQYKFYSIANDSSGNLEALPLYADARCAHDATSPEITDNSSLIGTTADAYSFESSVTDSVILSEVHAVYRFGNTSEINVTLLPTTADNYSFTIFMPSGSVDDMLYRIEAADEAGNWNSTALKRVTLTDNDAPLANAGINQTVSAGDATQFNGSASTDNIGIVNYTWMFNDSAGIVLLYSISPTHIFSVAGNYSVTLTTHDAAGNTGTAAITLTVMSVLPVDSDGDLVPDANDAFPEDPDESQDTDDDGIGDNADTDDDGDGYLDDWEIFLGTDPFDQTDTPPDADDDGTPDGDAANSQPWMDMDDDDDGMPDSEENVSPAEEPGFFGQYWWLILLIALIAVIGLMAAMRQKSKPVEAPKEKSPTPETELCPKCGFEIEKGSPCPFCASEKPPEPPKAEPPQSALTNEEKLARIEKAYKDGKMSEEQYLINVKKFSKE